MAATVSIIDDAISKAIGEPFITQNNRTVGGGSINSASVIYSEKHSFFLKTNSLGFADMFEAEFDGLQELANAKAIRVPKAICTGTTDSQVFLVLENLNMHSGSPQAASILGRHLALLHKTQADQFGWFRDNTIGSTRQVNQYSNNWVDFYREHRLQFQLALAEENGFGGELQQLGDRLCEDLARFFKDYKPYPALLHGDLWSGNYAYVNDEPVIFDPATYYGDREADIAMTELFGGFPAAFYQAYNAELPLDKGYEQRKNLYNLYHILNHLNLFGSGYYSQAINMLKGLLP